jgi:hypothetical protein
MVHFLRQQGLTILSLLPIGDIDRHAADSNKMVLVVKACSSDTNAPA